MWWEILKRQVASTKGKQFQLDFNQPMIEEDNTCKERFLEMLNKVDKLGDSLEQKINTSERKTPANDYPFYSRIINPSDYKELPEEVYCEALDFYDQHKDKLQGFEDILHTEFTYPEDGVEYLKVFVVGLPPVKEFNWLNNDWKTVGHKFLIKDNHDRNIAGFWMSLEATDLSSEDIEIFRNAVESI